MEPRAGGGLGVLDPSLLFHSIGTSTTVLAQQPLPCQVSYSIGVGLGPVLDASSALERLLRFRQQKLARHSSKEIRGDPGHP